MDLWRRIRNKPPAPPPSDDEARVRFTIVPIIGSNPSTGIVAGVGGQWTQTKPGVKELSSGIAAFTFSTRGKPSLSARFRSFPSSGDWLVEGDNRFLGSTQPTYGFGATTPDEAAVDAQYSFVRLYETVYYRVRPHLFVGGGLLYDSHTDIEPTDDDEALWDGSPVVEYSTTFGFPIESQQSAGFSVNALLDTRDSGIDAHKGFLAKAVFNARFSGFLGGDSSWQSVMYDVRMYRPLSRNERHRLAAWLYGDLITSGNAPFFDTPSTVSDTFSRSARGYREGRYRGQRLVYAEAEYRTTLTSNGLLGAVAFANVTTVSNWQTGERLFDDYAPAGGGGLRLSVDKHSRTNLCLDFGWGKAGSWGMYLAIQEAF